MDINVKSEGWYSWKTVTVQEGNTVISYDADKSEYGSLAEQFREAACDLDEGEGVGYLNPGLLQAIEIIEDMVSDAHESEHLTIAAIIFKLKEELK